MDFKSTDEYDKLSGGSAEIWPMTLTIHHLAMSQSDRIIWLCEELALPYQLTRYERDPHTRLAPSGYKALHPARTAPVITDGDVVLAESGAIVEYLCRRYRRGQLLPSITDGDFVPFVYWFHYAGATMMPSLIADLLINSMSNPDNEMARSLAHRGNQCFANVERRLGEADYFAGSAFTAADIMMVFSLTTMRLFVPRALANYPNIARYLQRIGQRAAFQRAWAEAEPDSLPNLT